MNGFEERAICRAPAEEVFKILYDTSRIPEWWEGTDRVEHDGAGEVTRYASAFPDFGYALGVSSRTEGSCVVISCLVSDISYEWLLEPHLEGCAVRARVELPEREAHRLEAQRAEVEASLTRLVTLAEASG